MVEKMKIDLGCCERVLPGYIRVDINPRYDPDVVWDLNIGGYPFSKGTIDEIRANHILEHLTEPVLCMKEISRILAAEGVVFVNLPHPSSFNCMWGHSDHKRALPIEWFRSVCREVGLEIVDYRLNYWIGCKHSFLKGVLNSFMNFLANDLDQVVFERLCIYWFGGFNEMRLVLRKVIK